jgi:hypothetical protein
VHENLGYRNRAAFCHLAALPVITSVWLPLLVRRADPDDDFLYHHATGAALYQGINLLVLGSMWLGRTLPYRWMDAVSGGFLLAFLGVVALCLVGMHFMGALALAFQAWNGDRFWAPLVAWLMGYDAPSEE